MDPSLTFQSGFDDNIGRGDKAVSSLIRKHRVLFHLMIR